MADFEWVFVKEDDQESLPDQDRLVLVKLSSSKLMYVCRLNKGISTIKNGKYGHIFLSFEIYGLDQNVFKQKIIKIFPFLIEKWAYIPE
jgi:hypothetical protein